MGRVKFALPISFILILDMLIHSKGGKISNITGNLFGKIMLLFVGYASLSLFWAPNRSEGIAQLFFVFILIINSYILYHYIEKFKLLTIVIYTFCLYSFISFFQVFQVPILKNLAFNGTEPTVIHGWSSMGRFQGMTDNPNVLSVLLIFSIFLSIYSIKYLEINKKTKVFLNIGILTSLTTIFFTQSRKGLIFSFLFILCYFIFNFSAKKFAKMILTVFVSFLILIQFPYIQDAIFKAYLRFSNMLKFFEGNNGGDSSMKTRMKYMNLGMEGFYERPIFGHGVNSFKHYFDHVAHNNFVEILFGIGLIGLLIYYSLHVIIFRKLLTYRVGLEIGLFLFILILMDVGFISFESKASMFMLLISYILTKELVRNKISSMYEK
jgi:O-antigen ligase